MYNDVNMDILVQSWEKGRKFRKHYTRDFRDLDNLVDGVPINSDSDKPYVGDTTLAGLVRSIPRASLQQLPIFAVSINGTKNSVPAVVASYLLRSVVFNQDTFGKGILSTMQIGAQQALTHGYAPFMTATGEMFGEFGTTMRLMHYEDVSPETGIQSDEESNEWYVEADITPLRLRKIIERAEANPNTSWDVAALKELAEMEPEGIDFTENASEPRSNQRQARNSEGAGVYRFITNYPVGVGGKFITFCNQLKEKALRVIDNRSKFGYPRVQLLVIDPAPLTPFGVSRVRLASPNQNLMNAYYTNIMSMLIINSDPPILQRGRFITPVQLKRRAKWETQDQNATAELVTINNGALEQFVPMLKQFSQQVQNMMGKPNKDTDLGNTSPGAKQQIKYEDNSTNQLTNILENFLRQYALVALDTHICEQSGEYDIILDDEAKNAINRLLEQKNEEAMQEYEAAAASGQPVDQPALVPLIGDNNTFSIVWEDFYEAIKTWHIDIELSITPDEMEEKTRADLQDTLVTMTQNADPNDLQKQRKISQIEDRILEKTIPEMKRTSPSAQPAPVMEAETVETM